MTHTLGAGATGFLRVRHWSAGVNAMTLEEIGEALRNRLWTLNLQEVPRALNPALFHLREPGTEQRGDLDPERLSLGAKH